MRRVFLFAVALLATASPAGASTLRICAGPTSSIVDAASSGGVDIALLRGPPSLDFSTGVRREDIDLRRALDAAQSRNGIGHIPKKRRVPRADPPGRP